MSFLQKYPHLLEVAYDATSNLLQPLKPLLKPGGAMERLFVEGEQLTKGAIFDCQMCGQCVLHSTGLTCPMNCPKTLRNGPCGGVRPDGNCEVKPEMRCVWVKAVERAPKTPWAHEIDDIRKPVDNRLWNTSSWVNYFTKRDKVAPKGWDVEV